MVDVLLTHSYHLFYDRKQALKMQPYPPLGTLYAAALLRQQGFSVALFDTMLQNPERGFPAALALHRPKIVAIYEDHFNFLSKMCLSRMRQVAYKMVDAARTAGATVVLNGPDSSDHVNEYLHRGAQYVLLGEAEWTLLEVARALQLGRTVNASWAGSVLADGWYRAGVIRAVARVGLRARWHRPAEQPVVAAARLAAALARA